MTHEKPDTHITPTPAERAGQFLKEAGQFRLGALVTETPHPASKHLSDVAESDIPGALGVLFDVDSGVVQKFKQWAGTDLPRRAAADVVRAVTGGGKVFCTGCGATGRLSIQLVSIWRDFWQRAKREGVQCSFSFEEMENRLWSVMAGGDFALIKSVEGFEDFTQFGRRQIADLGVSEGDAVFAITEGGETPFVIGTAWEALERGANVYFVYNNPDSVLREHVTRSRQIIDEPRITKINLTTGPMAITGSTRMQATSIQLAAMLTIFELALGELTNPHAPRESVPDHFAASIESVHHTLQEQGLRDELAALVSMEEEVYRSGHKNTYFAGELAIDVLTDTTERSPTFCTPAFKKWDDPQAAESWSFLFLPRESTADAWEHLLKRPIQPVEWSFEDVRALIGEDLAGRQHQMIRQIGSEEILRFRIGLEGLSNRPISPGDCATAIITGRELDELVRPDGFFRRQLEAARAAGAEIGVVFVGEAAALSTAREFVRSWSIPARGVFLEVRGEESLLRPAMRVGAKMLLNALSTCTMVRMGRVLGNVMIWVVPSNLKLIDRSTRYISQLADVSYEDACRMLFEVIQHVSARMASGQAYPPPVGVSVMRLKHGLSNAEAEARLLRELP